MHMVRHAQQMQSCRKAPALSPGRLLHTPAAVSLPMPHQIVFVGIVCGWGGLPHAGPQRVHCSIYICTLANCERGA